MKERVVRAVSSDRAYQVRLDAKDGEWDIWEMNQNSSLRVVGRVIHSIPDTGQDARDVLEKFLRKEEMEEIERQEREYPGFA